MQLHNQEHSPRGTIFTRMTFFFFFFKLFFLSLKGPGCGYDTETGTNHCGLCILFLLVHIAAAQTLLVSPENQSMERYTVH